VAAGCTAFRTAVEQPRECDLGECPYRARVRGRKTAVSEGLLNVATKPPRLARFEGEGGLSNARGPGLNQGSLSAVHRLAESEVVRNRPWLAGHGASRCSCASTGSGQPLVNSSARYRARLNALALARLSLPSDSRCARRLLRAALIEPVVLVARVSLWAFGSLALSPLAMLGRAAC
jgi:hypothetical protein